MAFVKYPEDYLLAVLVFNIASHFIPFNDVPTFEELGFGVVVVIKSTINIDVESGCPV